MPSRKTTVSSDPQVISCPTIFAKGATITLVVLCHTCKQKTTISLKNYWKFRKGTTDPWSCYTCRKPAIDAAASLNPLYKSEDYKKKFADLHSDPDYHRAVHNPEVSEKIATTTRRLWMDPKTRANHLAHRRTEEYRNRISKWSNDYWGKQREEDRKKRTLGFIAKATHIHDGKFDYSESEYTTTTVPIEIKCARCSSSFHQLPMTHLRGSRCPYCDPPTTSAGQLEIYEFIIGLTGKTPILNDRTAIAPHEIDIYLPTHKLGIEYHGIYWHSYNRPETKRERYRHQEKFIKSQMAGIKLLQFCDFEWRLKREIVESMISNQLGLSRKLHARKLDLVEMDNRGAAAFFDSYHLAGHRDSKWCWCLIDDKGPAVAMSFNRYGPDWIEIMRLATRAGCVVRGGAARLLAAAIASLKPAGITTFADLRYSTGGVYKQIGFVESHRTPPGYFYHLNGRIRSRLQCQKHKLSGFLPHFDAGLSESLNMFANDYRRFWDAGNLRLNLELAPATVGH